MLLYELNAAAVSADFNHEYLVAASAVCPLLGQATTQKVVPGAFASGAPYILTDVFCAC